MVHDNQMLQLALQWHKHGYSVFPTERGGKRPIVRWSEFRDKQPPLHMVMKWFGEYNFNMSVCCGGVNKLAVVDFDTKFGYYKAVANASEELRGIIDKTFKVRTCRGMHVYFKVETRSRKNSVDKIDVKGEGGYVVTPPSVHPSGGRYEIVDGSDIANIQTITNEQLCMIAGIPEYEPRVDYYDDNNAVWDVSEDSLGFISDYDYVLNSVPILRAALRLTPMHQNNGRYWMGCCPVHNEKHPSFWVDTELGVAKCFSTQCALNDKAVNVIGLWAMAKNISYTDAMNELMHFV